MKKNKTEVEVVFHFLRRHSTFLRDLQLNCPFSPSRFKGRFDETEETIELMCFSSLSLHLQDDRSHDEFEVRTL